jgi:hypothetical protein
MTSALLLIASVSAVFGLVLFLIAREAAHRRRWQGTVIWGLAGLLFMTLATLFATVGVSIHGYRALTYEQVVATIRTDPTGPQRFNALVTYPDGRAETFDICGDAIYIDAHILKWQPWVNVMGLHTVYELDRVAGRFDDLADERARPRAVYSLARPKPLDLFDVARRFRLLSALVDAEYGSATFVGARGLAVYEILVSTSGLLARPVAMPRASAAGP